MAMVAGASDYSLKRGFFEYFNCFLGFANRMD
jgi:hypothetical protein